MKKIFIAMAVVASLSATAQTTNTSTMSTTDGTTTSGTTLINQGSYGSTSLVDSNSTSNSTSSVTSNNINTSTSNNVNTSTVSSTNTNNNINSGTMTYNNNNASTNTNLNTTNSVNQNIQSGSMTNLNRNESSITQKLIQPPPTAIAPAMMSVGTDLCVTGVSGAAQTQILGVSFGATQRDMNCERLKLSKTLYDMGMKVAAVATMCQDRRVFDAMLQAGTPCPYEGLIGAQAKAAWEANSEKIPRLAKE